MSKTYIYGLVDPRNKAIIHYLDDLRRMRDESHPHTAELLSSVILAIEAAIERREGE